MSRSRRHAPVFGMTTARSERWSKRFWHRRLRVAERTWIVGDPEPHQDEVSDPWSMQKDGRQRFDPVAHPEWLRK